VKTTVTKWGNSQGIRCITIKKEEPSTLEELLSDFYGKPFNQLTGKELQCDTDEWNTGKPVGREIW